MLLVTLCSTKCIFERGISNQKRAIAVARACPGVFLLVAVIKEFCVGKADIKRLQHHCDKF